MHGDTIVLGARGDDDAGMDSGSAYVFVRSGTTWTQQTKLTASDAAAGDSFGESVALSGDTIVVAAYEDDGAGMDSGSAYVFVRNGTAWSQQSKLTANDGAADDHFGESIALRGDTFVSGAPFDDDDGANSGSAYVFDAGAFITPFGTGCFGSNGLRPDHTSTGHPIAGSTVVYEVRDIAPLSAVSMWLGFSNTMWDGIPLPLNLGVLGTDPACDLLVAPVVAVPVALDGMGNGRVSLTISSGHPPDSDFYTQMIVMDPFVWSSLPIVVSNGLRTRTQ